MAMRICEAALERGVFAQAIRPPTVPGGTSRLRLAVMATHKEQELRAAARILGQVARAAGVARPAARPGTQLAADSASRAGAKPAARQRAYDIESEPARAPRSDAGETGPG